MMGSFVQNRPERVRDWRTREEKTRHCGYEIMRHDPLRSNLALKQKQARNLFAAALANISGSFYLAGKSRTGLLPRDRIR
jgi:hypothetical protein